MSDLSLKISVSDPQKNELSEIIKGRSEPGIFILNLNGDITYTNDKAREIFSVLHPAHLKEKIQNIIEWTACGRTSSLICDSAVCSTEENDYCFRPFLLNNPSVPFHRHILVIIEQVCKVRAAVNLDAVRKSYKLTRREQEIVGMLLKGFGTKDISQRLFICEYTVKDHLKNIMAKLAVNTRLEIVSKLFQHTQ